MSTFSSRWWRLPHLGRNPLVRSWDRIETVTLAVAVLIALLAIPFAGLLGSSLYAGQRAEVAIEAATRHQTTARLLADAAPDTADARGISAGGTVPVDAVWLLPDGSARAGTVPVAKGATAGTKVPIWLDESGNRVSAPITTEVAAMNGITVAVLAWLGAVTVGAVGFGFVRWGLDRRRYAQWDDEWRRLGTKRSHY
ncbi:MAG TPA: hypothetical protein VJT49_07585 [Amycolatopsis sp.]|uniref:Rv1733c family protein n=1 Tax=Amycolatopsis sp. TaxID=37632 RepID=UPI002B4685DB|nr:hypothetical protein [Amycolatopsis sp.]HKS44969.1 hypothetical protein [Amycolatopsis sp.]